MITFPVTASLVSFFIWESKSENNSGNNYLPLALFYFFIGVALIAKGLIGIVFPFAIVAFYYLLCLKIPAKTFLISLVWGTVLSILVASSWYLPVYLVNGWEFVDEFFIQHHFQRFTSNKFKHPQPFWFFWLILPAMTIPWIPFFLASVWEFAKKNYQYISTKEPQNKAHLHIPNSKLRLFAVCWMLVPLVFFSLSGSKLPGYILPALPAACILTAEFVVRFIENDLRRKYFLQGLGLLTFVVVAILLQFAVPRYAELDSTRHMVEIANEKGYKNEKIINMHTISHNIEFYGNGRLMRSADGRQRRFDGVSEVVNYLEKENQDSVLVLIPHQFIGQLTKSDLITTEILDRNYELEMVAVKLKKEKNEN
jgi:4-amino-4-deoxy-L-arabinose transferase-like glycosyltransferase